MMRPFTLICMVSAFGAGLYLYQSKHQAQVLDREIGRTIKLTESTRERTGMLRAEWALLNEPDRLAELAKAHTSLQTLKPTQFVGLNDLASRLPAPVANNRERLPVEAEPEDVPAVPVAQAAPPVVAPTVAGRRWPLQRRPRWRWWQPSRSRSQSRKPRRSRLPSPRRSRWCAMSRSRR